MIYNGVQVHFHRLLWGRGFATPFSIHIDTAKWDAIDTVEQHALLAHEYQHVLDWRRLWVLGFAILYAASWLFCLPYRIAQLVRGKGWVNMQYWNPLELRAEMIEQFVRANYMVPSDVLKRLGRE
jgi:hypothetical protein